MINTTSEKNIKNLLFKENKGPFLMGALVAMMSKSDVIGFVGGIDMTLINKFKNGYEQGAKYINPNIKVLSAYIGGTTDFRNTKEIIGDEKLRKLEVIIEEIKLNEIIIK